jgi:hypothetical protein
MRIDFELTAFVPPVKELTPVLDACVALPDQTAMPSDLAAVLTAVALGE